MLFNLSKLLSSGSLHFKSGFVRVHGQSVTRNAVNVPKIRTPTTHVVARYGDMFKLLIETIKKHLSKIEN